MTASFETITLGGGCFWCLEAVYQQVKGVEKVISGYAGGHVPNPDYETVCAETTGHAEVVQLHFDPRIVSYRQILEIFFVIHDPTTLNYQGNDVGARYRSVIFTLDDTQMHIAKELISELSNGKHFSRPIVTEIQAAPIFYPAEDYHQNYFIKNGGKPYCAFVIQPKLDNFILEFNEMIKSELSN